MNFLTLLLLALSLSIDSTIVSITCGMQGSLSRVKNLTIALSFALAQGLFPLLGALLGSLFHEYIHTFDHWIAFGLLSIIGVKMLLEIRSIHQNKSAYFDISRNLIIFGLAIATSIDAFVLGIGLGIELPTLSQQLGAASLIAFVTFLASSLGLFIGKQRLFFPAKWATAIGGIVLIAMGLKILYSHQVLCAV